MKRLQEQSFLECSKELVRQVASPNTNVREQAINLLQVKPLRETINRDPTESISEFFQLLSEITKKSITEIMLPHKEVLVDIVPPKKHLLRHQPVNAQIGLMEGTSFCTTLNPRYGTDHKTVLSGS
jgi:transformation/transcription domain-associated protein